MELPKLFYQTPEYVITDYPNKPDSILQYNKHFTSILEERELPPSIFSYYFPNNKSIFQYLIVSGKLPNPIPVPREAISRLLSDNKPDRFSYIQNYQSGFLRGFKHFSIPFTDILVVDTPENRKELILKTISMGISSFPAKLIARHIDFPSSFSQENFSPDEFFEFGEKVGRVYKAWYYILQSPRYYESDIAELIKKANTIRIGVLRPSQKGKYKNYLNLLAQSEDASKVNNFNSPNKNIKTNSQIVDKATVIIPSQISQEEAGMISSLKTNQQKVGKIKEEPRKTNTQVQDLNHEQDSSLKLNHFITDETIYNKVMKILVIKGHIQPETHIWKDTKKAGKSHLAALLKFLHLQGYYKSNTSLTHIQIKEVAKNTFASKLSIQTIKMANIEKFNFSYIPLALSLTPMNDLDKIN